MALGLVEASFLAGPEQPAIAPKLSSETIANVEIY
jgi:hypothetical protein